MTSPLVTTSLPGYTSQTLAYKSTEHGDILLDVLYPEDLGSAPRTVLLHYHGGFLIGGDRHSFPPQWLLRAAAKRGWIFVSPDYRLMPESTAQGSVADAVDAYQWVLSELPKKLGRDALGPVLVAGSSAGAYLALTTAASVQKQPAALLLIYGMLDATAPRYLTPGTNTFGMPPVPTADILEKWPIATGTPIFGAPLSADPSQSPRLGIVMALHLDALFLDYMTGISGLGRAVAKDGIEAIPAEHRNLFPVAFDRVSGLAPTFLLHGQHDNAVPMTQTLRAVEKLKAAGVQFELDTPEDAQHGFDVAAGDVDVESAEGEKVTAVETLRKAIKFLEAHAA